MPNQRQKELREGSHRLAEAIERGLDHSDSSLDHLALSALAESSRQIYDLAKSSGYEACAMFYAERALAGVDSATRSEVDLALNLDYKGGVFKGMSLRCERAQVEEQAARAACVMALDRDPDWALAVGRAADAMQRAVPIVCEDSPASRFVSEALRGGGAVKCFVEICSLERAARPGRERLEASILERVKEAAAAGVLPSIFSSSELKLSRGWAGSALEISHWRLPEEARCKYSGGKGQPNVLAALASCELPGLAAGDEAVWEAFCERVELAQARGWKGVGLPYGGAEAEAAQRRGIEAAKIGQAASLGRKTSAKRSI